MKGNEGIAKEMSDLIGRSMNQFQKVEFCTTCQVFTNNMIQNNSETVHINSVRIKFPCIKNWFAVKEHGMKTKLAICN